MKNVLSETKKSLNEINSQLGITETNNSELEDLVKKIFQNKVGNKYRNRKWNRASTTYGGNYQLMCKSQNLKRGHQKKN